MKGFPPSWLARPSNDVIRFLRLCQRHRSFIWVLVIGLLVRYALALYSAEQDSVTFAAASLSMAYGQSPYTYLVFYPPGWVFLLGLIGRSFSLLFGVGSILAVPTGLSQLNGLSYAWYESPFYPTPGFEVFFKSFIFVFDVLNGLLIYIIALERTGNSRAALAGGGLWFLNPLVIFVSAIHGTYDAIPAFLVLLAYYLATKHDFLFAGHFAEPWHSD